MEQEGWEGLEVIVAAAKLYSTKGHSIH